MNESQSYNTCYKILNINNRASADDLKKSYRSLIQKWHPDRYRDEVKKAEANNKLQELNVAYKILSDYYKKHNILPLSRSITHSTKQKFTATESKKTQRTSYAKEKITATNRKNKIQYVFIVFFLIVTLNFVYQYLDSIILSLSTPLEYTQDIPITPINIKKRVKEEDSDTQYFTYGSSIGEVIEIQGPPDRIVENVWFYGESEIHFKNGYVDKWTRTTSKELKAQDTLINR